ncbi:MAG: aminoacetone oxidase family FAD-binding enzyme, partial [Verrucomicrobiota bacterium]
MPDLVVIGGGTAGFFGAIACAESLPKPADILILEKSSHLLTKVKISGGGRCNVTHACFDPRELTSNYPRGERSLMGPFHQWRTEDTVDWFEARGVELKTEADGRMFPTTDNSQTIIDCLTEAARELGIRWETKVEVREIEVSGKKFCIRTTGNREMEASAVLLATGGTRSAAAAKPAKDLGHALIPAMPSLFTFHIDDPRLRDLPGLSVPQATVQDLETKQTSRGPLLITHWGLSGPAVLKLSAWGAREMAKRDYRFEVEVNWLGDESWEEAEEVLRRQRAEHGSRQIASRSPFESLPRRLWNRLVEHSGISKKATWANLPKQSAKTLLQNLVQARFQVSGKSLNKEEFVTCGGVRLKDVNLK